MGPSAGFNVPISGSCNSDFSSRHNASLIQPEAVLLFRLFSGHPRRFNRYVSYHRLICQPFNLVNLLSCQPFEVRDVQPRSFSSLLRPCLPNMFPQNSPSRSHDNVSRGVMLHETASSFPIDGSSHFVSFSRNTTLHSMKDDAPNLLNIHNL